MAISAYDLKNLTSYATSLGITTDKLAEMAGTRYLDTISANDGRALTRKLDALAEQQKPAPADGTTGWSNAAKRRRGEHVRSHPLGTAVEQGDGYTVYEDEAFGGGRVQIWDES